MNDDRVATLALCGQLVDEFPELLQVRREAVDNGSDPTDQPALFVLEFFTALKDWVVAQYMVDPAAGRERSWRHVLDRVETAYGAAESAEDEEILYVLDTWFVDTLPEKYRFGWQVQDSLGPRLRAAYDQVNQRPAPELSARDRYKMRVLGYLPSRLICDRPEVMLDSTYEDPALVCLMPRYHEVCWYLPETLPPALRHVADRDLRTTAVGFRRFAETAQGRDREVEVVSNDTAVLTGMVARLRAVGIATRTRVVPVDA